VACAGSPKAKGDQVTDARRAEVHTPAIVTTATEDLAMFATNVGTVDRGLRIVVGLALLALVFVGPQTPWGLIGLVPLATGLARKCPAYSLLGMNTCGDKKTA
jgi:hypothetical protein